jgi:hypothetical protein
MKRTATRRAIQRIWATFAILVTTLHNAVVVLGCLLAQSACTPPDEGRKALAGFKASGPILQGLGEYYGKNGAYPDKLELLAPSFVTPAHLNPPSDIARYEYERNGAGFSFAFRYYGPGSNTCTFESTSRSWDCRGYY